MNRPLHVWASFLICLLLVAAGMGWLTVKVVELDRAEARMTLHADFEADVRLALHRMDKELAEIVATETAWPHYVYEAFYWPEPVANQVAIAPGIPSSKNPFDQDGDQPQSDLPAKPIPVASPLQNPTNRFVNLYFQVGEDNNVDSPNVPTPELESWAYANGSTVEQIGRYQRRLGELQEIVSRNDINVQLPEVEPLPAKLANKTAQTNDTRQIAIVDDRFPSPPNSADREPSDPFNGDAQHAQQQPAPQGSVKGRLSKEEQLRRGNSEYFKRKRQVEQHVTNWNQLLQQQHAYGGNTDGSNQRAQMAAGLTSDASIVLEGRSRALWVDQQLVLARRVKLNGKPMVQGCWLDWSAIKRRLAVEVADILPEFELTPVYSEAEADLGRTLASLPAQIVVDPPRIQDWSFDQSLSPMQLALVAAWSCLLAAAGAVALLLAGVVSLSERRAAFVSAVTHELRTPLTTFRMYAEMLAEGMVPDPARRQQYLGTLKTEADRLHHLVENVLSYARLERGRNRSAETTVSVKDLIAGMTDRLTERAAQANMSMHMELDDTVGRETLTTDIGSIEQIVGNLVDNACKYAVAADDRRIHLSADTQNGRLQIRVRDHGPGIPKSETRRLFQPFTKSARDAADSAPGVGLGLALCRRMARQLGGSLQLETPPDGGACFVLSLPTGRPSRPTQTPSVN